MTALASFRGQFAATGRLLLASFHRDRLRLITWVAAIPGLFYAGLAGETGLFPDQAGLEARAAIMDSATGVMFGGPRYGLSHYDWGAIVMNEFSSTIMICLAIMAITLVVHSSRAEEESGRAELVGAAVTGRQAPLAASLIETLAACLAISALNAAVMLSTGLPMADSLAAAFGFGLVGCVFAALGLLTSQIAASARGASAAALAAMGLLYLIRVAGDMPQAGGTVLSWFSPFAWAQQTRAFDGLRWWPLFLLAALTLALVTAAVWCAWRRDLGAGLVPARRAAPNAPAGLKSPLSLAVRLARPTWLGWTGSSIILGATCGPIAATANNAISENSQWARLLGFDQSDLSGVFLAMMLVYCALIGCCFAVASAGRAHTAEVSGLTELVLAQPVPRWRLLGSYALVSVAGGALASELGVLALGLGAQAAGQGDWLELAAAGLAYLPVVALFTTLTLAIYAWAPRASGLAWAVLVYGAVAAMFGKSAGLPRWAVDLGGIGAIGAVPYDPYRAAPVIVVTLAAAALGAAAFGRFTRRDVP